MKKHGIMASILLTGTITIGGCNYLMPPRHLTAQSRLPSRQQVCSQLRHDIIFNNNPTGPNYLTGTPIQEARSAQQYQYYNCDQYEPAGRTAPIGNQ